jgi:hypothetical protein
MRPELLYGITVFALTSVVGACSKGASSNDGVGAPSPDQIAAQSTQAFLNPQVALGTIPSSLAGVSTWTFYNGSQGTVAVGEDASFDLSAAQVCPTVAEVSVVTDSSGKVTGAGYAISNSLGVSPTDVASALNTDLNAVSGSTSAKDLHTEGIFGDDGGPPLVIAGGSLVVSCAAALVQGFASEALSAFKSAISGTACPANAATPCTGGTASASSTGAPSVANTCGSTGNVDQAAIGETTNGLLAPPFASNLSDQYNVEDPFAISGTGYASAMTMRLQGFDAIDGHTDWTTAQIASYVGRMSTSNYLILDTSMPCDFANPHTYLEIERAQLTGGAHLT